MRRNRVPTVLALAACAAPALAQSRAFQIRADEVLLGDGSRIASGVVLVEEGKIKKVGRGVEVDPSLPLIEHDGFLSAGLVACDTESATRGQASDPTRNVMPDARVVDTLDRDHPDLARALASGITSVVLSPGAGNLVGGRTAVVKTTGEVVLPEAHLALSFSKRTFGTPTGGGDVEHTERSSRSERGPTSYAGALRELEGLFAEPEGAFAAAERGELPVLIEAWDRNEVERACAFASEHGLRGALRGVRLGVDLVEPLRASGLGVVLGPFPTAQDARVVEGVRALGEAGVPLAFALAGPAHDPEQVRLSAAMAVSLGADPTVVWRALTSDAARIAGAAGRIGLLERGRDADLVLWSGDPLNLTSRVEAVYVDGALVHRGGSR